MITISKSKLKAKILEYFRQVEESGEEIIVTSHNQPVLRILPIKQIKKTRELFSDLWGKVTIPKDIMEPETESPGLP
jgi:prevent-host-death family protein